MGVSAGTSRSELVRVPICGGLMRMSPNMGGCLCGSLNRNREPSHGALGPLCSVSMDELKIRFKFRQIHPFAAASTSGLLHVPEGFRSKARIVADQGLRFDIAFQHTRAGHAL